jgi:transposase
VTLTVDRQTALRVERRTAVERYGEGSQPQPGDQEILDRHLAGESYAKLADAYGVTRERIRQRVQRADPEGYARRQEERRTKVTSRRGQIRVMRAAGKSQREVSKELGVSRSQVDRDEEP